MPAQPIRVAVTGAAGQIGYSLIFRLAAGFLPVPKAGQKAEKKAEGKAGKSLPIILQLLEIPQAMEALEGVVMELDDCAFPLLRGIEISDQPEQAFKDADLAILVGSRPRTKGMERKDLLEANGAIFTEQGRALQKSGAAGMRILVVGNPANTNCLIAMKNAPEIPSERFTAMTRLDHNRALAQVSQKLNTPVTDIKKMTIWGNHSATQYPDLFNCQIGGKSVRDLVGDDDWIANEFIPAIQQRGAAIIGARGASSAASAANAAIDHIKDWAGETPKDDWVSMSVLSDGSYGVPEGLISSFPCRTSKGEWEIVQGLELAEFSQTRITATVKELEEERDAVVSLGLIG